MKIKLLILSIIILNTAYSQWSTSPYADSGLYVCPGFDPGIVTFDDGSSIVLGLLSSYIYAQKLDPEGYKVWPQPVLIFHNDSSDMVIGNYSDRTWFCSDGDGGVILFWQDYRGAYYAQDGPKNNTTYLQRIDKNGTIRWRTDGIKVNNLEDGYKTARITSDGSGGCVLLSTEYGYDYPGSPNKNYLKLGRYNADGNRLWQQTLDSTFSGANPLWPYDVIRAGKYYYLGYGYVGGDFEKRIDENGPINSLKNLSPISYIPSLDNNSLFFYDYKNNIQESTLGKINGNGDTLWIKIFSLANFCPERATRAITDSRGGIFLVHICQDSIIYVDSLGHILYKNFAGIDFGGEVYNEGNNGILVATTSLAKRFSDMGKMVWPDAVTFLNDPSNAYTSYAVPDNNGGLIVVYWSTIGGIFAQHTGRNGKFGIVTGVENPVNNIPYAIELYQNYPNPFNSSTNIKYNIEKKSKVLLNIYDILGRKVKTVVDKIQEKGTYSINVDLPGIASGVYFYRLMTDNKIHITRKMLLTK